MSREAIEFENVIRQHAEGVHSRKPKPRMATISSYNPAKHAVKVIYQPEGVESAWMPLAALGVGNGFGLLSGPNEGDMVEVDFTDNDYATPKVIARFFSNAAVPPAVPSGEHWLVHESGSFIKVTNDGKVTVRDAGGSTVVMNGDGTGTMSFADGLTIDANTTVNGWIKASGDITDSTGSGNSRSMAGMRQVNNGHTHNGTDSHGDSFVTDPPNQQE